MKKPLPKAKLGDVVHDLTVSRTFSVKSDDIIVDPTIQSATHKISAAATSRGFEVRVHKRILIKTGDLVFSRLHTQNGAFAFSEDIFQATGTFVPLEIRTDRADHRFLFWALHKFVPSLSASDTVGRETYKTEDILALEIPLPPLAEQRRIVARIEELAAQIQEARTLRQQAAEETGALPLAELSTYFRKQENSLGSEQIEELLLDACYGTSEKCVSERMDGGFPVLRIPNVALERITQADLKFARLGKRDSQRLILSEGDILVVRTNGSLNLVGRSAVVPALDEPFAFASYMIRLRFDRKRILPEYAQRMLQHLRVSGALVDFARTTAGQYNVSLGRLRSAKIPIPPLTEQRRIVAELDTLQTEVDRLKALQAETAAELDALLPSILDRAFKGEL